MVARLHRRSGVVHRRCLLEQQTLRIHHGYVACVKMRLIDFPRRLELGRGVLRDQPEGSNKRLAFMYLLFALRPVRSQRSLECSRDDFYFTAFKMQVSRVIAATSGVLPVVRSRSRARGVSLNLVASRP